MFPQGASVNAYLEAARGEEPLRHLLSADPDGVDDAGDVAQDGEQQADAELHLFKTKERPILLLVCYQDPDKAIELN